MSSAGSNEITVEQDGDKRSVSFDQCIVRCRVAGHRDSGNSPGTTKRVMDSTAALELENIPGQLLVIFFLVAAIIGAGDGLRLPCPGLGPFTPSSK